jgi:hypothetical protein
MNNLPLFQYQFHNFIPDIIQPYETHIQMLLLVNYIEGADTVSQTILNSGFLDLRLSQRSLWKPYSPNCGVFLWQGKK